MLKNVDESRLAARLHQCYPNMGKVWSQEHAKYIIETTDPRLEVDVDDWASGRVLNDTCFHAMNGQQYSIARILRTRQNDDFVGALQVMNLFFKDEKRAIGRIERLIL